MKEHHSKRKFRTLSRRLPPAFARVCQRLIVGLIALVLALAPLVGGAVDPWAVQTIEFLVGLAAFCWLLRVLALREIELVSSSLAAPLLAFATFVVVRYGSAEVEPIARPPMLLAVTAALFFFLVLNNVSQHRQLTALVDGGTILGTLLAGYGLWCVLADSAVGQWLAEQLPAHWPATFAWIRPAELVGYVGLVFPVTTAAVLFSRLSLRHKLLLAVGGVVMGFALGLSPARYAWVGLLTTALVLGVYLLRKRGAPFGWRMVAAVTVGFALVLALLGFQLYAMAETNPASFSLWRGALAVGRQDPWLGSGPGMFPWLYPAYRTGPGHPLASDNEYLNVFAEYGLVGVGLAVWALVGFVRMALQVITARVKRYSAATPSNRYAFAIGGLAAVTALAVQAVFNGALRAPATLLALLAIMAVVSTCGVHPAGRVDAEVERPGRYVTVVVSKVTRWVLVAGLAVVGILLARGLLPSYPSSLFFWQASREQTRLDWAAAETGYLRAHQFDQRSYLVATALGDLYAARGTWNLTERVALYEKALRWYRQAYADNPYANDLLVQRGRLFDVLGKRDQAAGQYRLALEADPANGAYHTLLGLHYQRWNQLEPAIASFRRALELGDPDPVPRLQLQQMGAME